MMTRTDTRPDITTAGGQATVATGFRGRRSVPRILGGLLMCLVGMAAFGVFALRATPAVEVLTVARPVPAGAHLTVADLSSIRLVPDPAMKVLLANERNQVIGRVAALPLAPGTVLLETHVAERAVWPPPGQAVIAVGVKSGRSPAGLTAGAAVLVLVVPPTNATGATAVADGKSPPKATGTVIAVQEPDTAGVTVVTVQLAAEAAVQIVSATGEVALVLQAPGR